MMAKSVFPHVTTAEFAIAGAAVLLAGAPDVVAPGEGSAVRLVSLDAVLAPLSPATDTEELWWLTDGDALVGPAAAPTSNALTAGPALIGPGGLLIGDRCGLICKGVDGAAGEDSVTGLTAQPAG